jgi:hypothetical protein
MAWCTLSGPKAGVAPRGNSRIVRHARACGDIIITCIINEGSITLDPPRIEIAMTDVYAA